SLRPSQHAPRSRASRYATAGPGISPDRATVAASDSKFDLQEIIRGRGHLFCEYLPLRLTKRPSETDPSLRRKAVECIPVRNTESRTRPSHQNRMPSSECCCHSQTLRRRFVSVQALLRRGEPSIPENVRRSAVNPCGAVRSRP